MESRERQSSRSTESLDSDELFYLLGNDRRRSTVEALARDRRTIEVSDLADEITGEEDGSYKSVYVSLQQSHLPQLDEHGVIRYDREAREVSRGPNFDEIAAYVTPDQSRTQRWQVYLVGAVVALAATGSSALLPGGGGVVTAAAAAVSIAVLLGYAGYETLLAAERADE
jgi:hypothetical protein